MALLSAPQFKGKDRYFGGIQSAEFRRVVRPGDTMKLSVHLTKIRHNIGIGKAEATVDGERACSAELTFFIG